MVKDYEFRDILMNMFSELNDDANDMNRDYWKELFQVEYECPDYPNKKEILVSIIEYYEEFKHFENNKYRITFERIREDDEDYDKTLTM